MGSWQGAGLLDKGEAAIKTIHNGIVNQELTRRPLSLSLTNPKAVNLANATCTCTLYNDITQKQPL